MASCGAEPTSPGAPALPGGLNPAGMEAPSGLPLAADVPSCSHLLPSAGMQPLPTGGEPPPGCEPAEKPPGPDDLGGLTLSHLRPIPSGAPSGTHAPFRAQVPCGVKRTLARQQTIQPEVAAQVLAECSGRQVPVASLADGTALPLLAREHCVAFLHMLGDPARLAPNRPIKIGTACTGSAADLFAFSALEEAYQQYAPRFEVSYAFNCESDKGKRQWGKKLHGLCPGSSPARHCMFTDIACLQHGTAECDEHEGPCKVQPVDVFVCATSCKDFSRANPKKQKRGQLPAPPTGESARTLSGMNDFLGAFKPSLFLFENVDSIDDAASGQCSDMDLALVAWANMGYECQKVIVNSHQFGIPACRNRMLVIGVQTMANAALNLSARSLSCMFTTMRSLIRVCQRSHTCASGVLLAADDPAVRDELIRRQSNLKKKAASDQPTSGCYNVATAMETASQRGVKWGSFPPSACMQADPWFTTLTRQQQDALCFSLLVHPGPCLFRDVSQSLGLTRLSSYSKEDGKHCASTVLPHQMLIVFATGQPLRLLLGREALVLQGFPSQNKSLSELTSETSETAMANIAGNMVSTTIMLAVAMAAISSVSWRSVPRPQLVSSSTASADALALLFSVVPSPPKATSRHS